VLDVVAALFRLVVILRAAQLRTVLISRWEFCALWRGGGFEALCGALVVALVG
jgi:hypothetical protein